MVTDNENITAIILAGGKSSRMGEDKGLMLLDGKPMIQYIIDTVSTLTDKVIIIANQEGYKQLGWPVYPDLIAEKGPLGGIVTGLSSSTTAVNWIVSCDVPFVSTSLLNELRDNLNDSDVVLPLYEGRLHPLIGVYKKDTLKLLKEKLSLNKLKLRAVLETVKLKKLNMNHFPAIEFKNLNSKTDL